MTDINTLGLDLQGTLAIVNKIDTVNKDIKGILDDTSSTVTRLSNSGNFTSLASDATVAEYNRLKGRFEDFYATINAFKVGLEKQSMETIEKDRKAAATVSGN